MDETSSLFIANDPEGQIAFPFTEMIQPEPPFLGAVEPASKSAASRTVLMQDLYSAKADHHKSLRRLAGELLPDCICLTGSEQAAAIFGASMMVRMRAGDRTSFNGAAMTREAAQLFSRLPDNTQHALAVLEILSKFVNYIEDGIIDLSGLEGPGVRRLGLNAPSADQERKSHLKLVSGD